MIIRNYFYSTTAFRKIPCKTEVFHINIWYTDNSFNEKSSEGGSCIAQSIKAHILCIPVLPAIDNCCWQFLPSDRLFRRRLIEGRGKRRPLRRLEYRGSGNSGSDAEAPAQMQTVPAKNVPMPMPLLFPPHPVRHAMVMTAFPLTPPIFPMDM